MAPEVLERILAELLPGHDPEGRVLAGLTDNEDAAVVRVPPGMALVQTVDFFTPIVNDPYWFGQIAAANAVSDVFVMGGVPWCALNIVCFPADCLETDVLREILRGGRDKAREAGAVIVGGHSVTDQELKYGLSVTGIIDPETRACNAGLRPGDQLFLTKPLGIGVLATGVKAALPQADAWEALTYHWAAKLNQTAGEVIRALRLGAATDVTGFGLGGHVLEMARASAVEVALEAASVPMLAPALELAALGVLPAGLHANRAYAAPWTHVAEQVDPVRLDLIFDPQTSGGAVLAVPEKRAGQAARMLEDKGELAVRIGEVRSAGRACLRIV